MLRSWISADKSIEKEVMKSGIFIEKPTECSACNVIVKNINITGASHEDLREKYYTEILDGDEREKVLIIGEASAEIDRKIERVIHTMNIHETSRVFITMPFKQSEVNSGSVMINFEITLTKCERYKSIWEWSAEEKYEIALMYKQRGVQLFKDSRINDAFYKFSRGCKLLITLEPISDLELDPQIESNINNLRLVLYNNMAMCQLSHNNYEHVITLCTKVLNKDKNNVKAMYRRGIAYGSMKNNEKAVQDLKAALTLEPNNRVVKENFDIYNTRLHESIQKHNDMVKKMFKT